MEKYGTLVFLAFSSLMDIRKKEISLPFTLLYGLAGLICSIRTARNLTDYLIPFGTGIFILAFSILTRGQVGMGDGWILLSLGCMLPTERYIRMVCNGMLLAAGCSGVMLILFHKNRKTEIPLVPFLLAGYIGGLIF